MTIDEKTEWEKCLMLWKSHPADGPIVSDVPLTLIVMRGQQKLLVETINMDLLGGELRGIGVK